MDGWMKKEVDEKKWMAGWIDIFLKITITNWRFCGDPVDQCFPNLSPCTAPFVCLPYQTHLIPLISSLVETARTKLGVSD